MTGTHLEGGDDGADLEKELTCSICTELLYQPLTLLDCLHTFCGSCLAEWFSFQHQTYQTNPNPPLLASITSLYTCPSCRGSVRDTKHNAIVKTLLEIYVQSHPEKKKNPLEASEIAKKYNPGDRVMPKVKAGKRNEKRVEHGEQRLIEAAREESQREAGILDITEESSGLMPNSWRREHRQERSRDESASRLPRTRNPNCNANACQVSHDCSCQRMTESRGSFRIESPASSNSDRNRPFSFNPSRGSHPDIECHNCHAHDRQQSPRRSADGADSHILHQVEHQSSLRSLIASDIDTQREIEEFSRQIQVERLLDGLDLDNINLSEDSELSRRITEAYRRHQKQRSRIELTRKSVLNMASTAAQNSEIPGGPSNITTHQLRDRNAMRLWQSSSICTSSSRPSARNKVRSRFANSTLHVDCSGPPKFTTCLGPTIDENTERRCRTVKESPTGSDTHIRTTPLIAWPAIHPTSDLPVRTPCADPPSSAIESVSNLDQGHTPSNIVTSLDIASGHHLSFNARVFTKSLPVATSPWIPPVLNVPVPSPAEFDALPSFGRSLPQVKVCNNTIAEPYIVCSSCLRPGIHYELHYNCSICDNGDWNLCLRCYRQAKGCYHWFGFKRFAQDRWEESNKIKGKKLNPPHVLAARRYLPPGIRLADDPESRVETGNFCSRCLLLANDCWWMCTHCNGGDWGFCLDCVNTGKCCTHPLLPLIYDPDPSSHDTKANASAQHSPNLPPNTFKLRNEFFYPFSLIIFTTACDICKKDIPATEDRLHCYECIGRKHFQITKAGDYDICCSCYSELCTQSMVSKDNSMSGWRRCLKGHRMAVVAYRKEPYGRRRVVVDNKIGGISLQKENYNERQEKWIWPTGFGKWASRLVSKSVEDIVLAQDAAGCTPHHPSSGGEGRHAHALYSWFPDGSPERQNELLFPRGAEISEVVEVSGEFWEGSYMGKVGIFPISYVQLY